MQDELVADILLVELELRRVPRPGPAGELREVSDAATAGVVVVRGFGLSAR